MSLEKTDHSWLGWFKNNDERELKIIYNTNYPKIRNYVLDNSGNEDDAQDIYHEAFIAVWRNIQLERATFENADRFQGYLFRVAQYNWLEQLRKRKRAKTDFVDTTGLGEIVDAGLTRDEEDYIGQVKVQFAKMGEPCRDLLHRFYFLKQKLKEIAEAFSWTEATAKNNKYRCLERLRRMILPQQNDAS